ncbi:MAG TPA: hypothetical protein VGH66_13885 [Acidimicrobiales bacterium]|jgi:hypothetical protein
MNLNRLIALGIRKGWRQGILGGNRTWLLIGAVALSARTVSRLAQREEILVFRDVIGPDTRLLISSSQDDLEGWRTH